MITPTGPDFAQFRLRQKDGLAPSSAKGGPLAKAGVSWSEALVGRIDAALPFAGFKPMLSRFTMTCLAALSPALASALNPVTWTLDETINRGQTSRFWTSPTAIDLGLQGYSYSYEITRVQATVLSFVTVDVTDQIAQSFALTGGGTAPALPATLLDAALNDTSTGTMADVHIYVDSSGLGRANFTNIALGTTNVPLFGNRNIDKIRVEATITLSGVLPPLPGDYNGDGQVSPVDRNVWRLAYGAMGDQPADGNKDNVVNAADYTVWRDAFDARLSAVAIPEPTSAAIVLLASCGGLLHRRRGF
jgi:hypothetical protein